MNITLGLPFVRTSVDHGTALDLAGTGKASSGSLIVAVETALEWYAAEPRFRPKKARPRYERPSENAEVVFQTAFFVIK